MAVGILTHLGARASVAAKLRVDRSDFPVGQAAGALVANFSDPFRGQGRGVTTYQVFGTTPGQLALDAGKLTVGAAAATLGQNYSVGVRATSGDGRKSTGETFTFRTIAAPGPVERSLGTVSEVPLFNVNGSKPAYISFDVMDGGSTERVIEIGIAGKDASNTPFLILYDRETSLNKDYKKLVNGQHFNIIENNGTDLSNASVPYRAVCKVTADGSIDCYLEGATRTNLLEAPYNSTAFENGAIMGSAIYMRVLSGPALNNVKYFPG